MLRRITTLLAFLLALLGAGCASYSGSGLKPGIASLDDVIRVMGQPAMQWTAPDTSTQLSYPRGPLGFNSYMVYVGADGKLSRIENVMHEKTFTRIIPGMQKDEVLRVLGPFEPGWTVYYKARDELAWEWRYCDAWNQAARFDVLFDNTRGTVRSTLSRREECGWMSTCGC